jgi:hypothetical protein
MNGNTPWLAAYLFAAWDGRYVARDITLDGNTSGSSQSVDKYHFVNDVTWGFALFAPTVDAWSWILLSWSPFRSATPSRLSPWT